MAATAAQFAREEILPAAADIDAKKPGVLPGLLRKAAELGLTGRNSRGVRRPGAGQDQLHDDHGPYVGAGQLFDGVRRADRDRDAAAGLVRHGGAEETLPAEAGVGEWISAYALSEASSGSDAMNIRTRATLSADGRATSSTARRCGSPTAASPTCSRCLPRSTARSFRHFLSSATLPGLTVGAEEHKLGHSRIVDLPAGAAGLHDPGGEPAGRTGQGAPHRVQRAECRPLQARRSLRGRSAPRTGAHDLAMPRSARHSERRSQSSA